MQISTVALAAILFCGSAQGTQSAVHAAGKPITVRYYPGLRNAAETRVRFAPDAAAITPGEIAACANLAVLRALGARAAGADRANQGRLADLTFVLCLTDSPTAG
ncbi:MAG: hypothetical protein WDN08_13500 [Rhizomicrobium sp.]